MEFVADLDVDGNDNRFDRIANQTRHLRDSRPNDPRIAWAILSVGLSLDPSEQRRVLPESVPHPGYDLTALNCSILVTRPNYPLS